MMHGRQYADIMMDSAVKRVNLLIFRGVFIKDLDVNPFTPSGPQITEPVYTEIPKRFTSVADWPKSSNLKCWTCDQLPHSYPRFVPLNPEKGPENKDICDTHGNFCEWNCVVEYVRKEFPIDQQWDILESICVFESKFSGQRKEKIVPSPPKTRMAMYCGKGGLTPKEWREELNRLNNEYNTSQYKLEHMLRDTQ